MEDQVTIDRAHALAHQEAAWPLAPCACCVGAPQDWLPSVACCAGCALLGPVPEVLDLEYTAEDRALDYKCYQEGFLQSAARLLRLEAEMGPKPDRRTRRYREWKEEMDLGGPGWNFLGPLGRAISSMAEKGEW